MTAHIKLQSSYGDFDPAFVQQLPALEKAMTDQGLQPSDCVIAKDEARGPRLPIAYRPDGTPPEYTVFVKGRSFTVRQPDDLSFLAYFNRLCVPAPENKDSPHSVSTPCIRKKKTGNADWPIGTLAQQADSGVTIGARK